MAYGKIHRGYEYPLIKFVVISESDIFGQEKKKKKKRKVYEGQKTKAFPSFLLGIMWYMKIMVSVSTKASKR